MAQIETRLKCDLDRMVDVEPLRGNLFSADNQANKILVEILKGGAAAEVSGAVYGYVIRQDGETVVVTGELSENVASIVLPSSCYAIVGQISIIIKVATTTVAACTGYVARSTTDTIVDPGHVVPSLAELLAKIADCEAATTAANTAAGLANEKAELAETKAGQANTAAGNANEAAGKINDMTTDAETTAPGTSAEAVISEVSGHKHIHFKIPRGNKGETGMTGAAGPQGPVGPQGPPGSATDEQIAAFVAAWLEDHPEATTTVEDGAITYPKLASSLRGALQMDENGDFYVLEEVE